MSTLVIFMFFIFRPLFMVCPNSCFSWFETQQACFFKQVQYILPLRNKITLFWPYDFDDEEVSKTS